MHYADEGSGEVVLLVHGTPTWSFEYRHLIKALAPARRCIAPDLLGFGLSERPLDFSYTPQAHAKVLSEFVEKMGSEHAQFKISSAACSRALRMRRFAKV
jgi:haloalkane dehalogenase